MFGANGLELCRIMEEELENVKIEAETGIERPKQEIEELLPEEAVIFLNIICSYLKVPNYHRS